MNTNIIQLTPNPEKTMSATKKPTPPKKEPLKADYRGATPRQVAESVLRYKPKIT